MKYIKITEICRKCKPNKLFTLTKLSRSTDNKGSMF